MRIDSGKVEFENSELVKFYTIDTDKIIQEGCLRIMYIGTIMQKALLKPMFEQLKNDKKIDKIEVLSVLSSNSKSFTGKKWNVAEYQEYLHDKGYTKVKYIKIENSEGHLKLDLNDLADISTKLVDYGKFDLIFCCFEMHFLVNWRHSLLGVLQYLKEDGSLYYSELFGDIAMYDGRLNVSDNSKHEELLKVFKNFLTERNKGYFWYPELSTSDYSPMHSFLSYFFKGIDEGLLTQIDPLQLHNVSFKKIIDTGTFGFLSWKVPDKAKMYISDDMENVDIQKKYQIKLFAARLFNKSRIISDENKNNEAVISIVKNSRASTNFVEGIKQIQNYEISDLAEKVLDIAENNDIFFNGITEYMGIFIPDEATKSKESKIFTRPKIDFNAKLSFMKEIDAEWKLPKEILFADLKIDHPIYFVYLLQKNAYDLPIGLNKVNWILMPNDSKVIGFQPSFDRTGGIKHLYIVFTSLFLNTKYNEIELEEVFASYEYLKIFKDPKKFVKLLKYILIAHFIPSNAKIDKDQCLSIMDSNSGQDLVKESQIICYFPAVLREKTTNYSDKLVSENLGGLFVKEKLLTQSINEGGNAVATIALILARNELLSRVANYILHRASLLHYVNKDYKRDARKAAIAAIGARNVSHNIGSHVIPAIKQKNNRNYFSNKLYHIINANNKTTEYISLVDRLAVEMEMFREVDHLIAEGNDTFSYYDDFLDYIAQRNDFINQLSSGTTNWSISVWFVRELMHRFLWQYYLLNSLGATEGLSIYNFLQYRKHKDDPKAINSDSFFDIQLSDFANGDKIMIYGQIRIEDDMCYLLMKKETNIIKFHISESTIKNIAEDNNTEINQLLNILKNQTGRKFRLVGECVNTVDGMYILDNGRFVERTIQIKVRIRKYRSKDQQGNWTVEKEYSEYLAQEGFFDILDRKHKDGIIEKRFSDFIAKSNTPVCFFGIISKISLSPEVLYIAHYQTDVTVTFKNNELNSCKDYLKEGTRIFFTANPQTDVDFKELNNLTINNAILKEISITEHLVSPDPFCDHSNIIKNDILVSIPGGMSGFQSFYTILENSIRNAVKHNWIYLPKEERIGRNMELKIELSKIKGEKTFICKVWSNLTNLYFEDGIPIYNNDHVINPMYNVSHILSEKINKIYVDDIITHDLKSPKNVNLGSVETKINAAYLNNQYKDFYDEKNYTGETVLLNDKQVGKKQNGYIRCSSIFEYYNDKIIPRLGLRFTLKQPVELSIIIDQETHEEINSLKNNQSINIIDISANDDSASNSVIYGEMCLILSNSDLNSFPDYQSRHSKLKFTIEAILNLLFILERGLSANEDEIIANKSELSAKLLDFTKLIELYPYRLLYLNRFFNIEKLPWKDNKKLKLSVEDYRVLTFFGSRVFVLPSNFDLYKETEFAYYQYVPESSNQNAPAGYIKVIVSSNANDISYDSSESINKANILKLNLYNAWVKLHKKKNTNPILQIKIDDYNPSRDEDIYNIPCLPPEVISLRLSSEINDAATLFPDSYPLLRYTRHSDEKKLFHSPTAYIEDLSGTKLSYGLFGILNSQSAYNKSKFCIRLIENALLNFLVLDDRIIKYFWELPNEDRYKFCNMGIIVPSCFESKENPRQKVILKPLKPVESSGYLREEFKKEVCTSKFRIEYYRIINSKNEVPIENDVINTIIIHQSLLEKMVEDEADSGNREQLLLVIINEFKMNFPSVIITSGRNKSNYADLARFIPFSIIEELLITKNPDKLTLSEMLLNTQL